MFVLNERHYGAICEGLAASGIADQLNIWAYSRIDTVKPEKLALLRAAGVRWLALGIESGSAHVRDGASKKLKNDDIVGVVREIQAAGINVIGNYIFGLPDDDERSMNETIGLALELNTEFRELLFGDGLSRARRSTTRRSGPGRRSRRPGAATASTTTTAGRSIRSTSAPPRSCASATTPSGPISRIRVISRWWNRSSATRPRTMSGR